MVEQVEEGPRPNRILMSNSSENASMSNGLSEKKSLGMHCRLTDLP